MDTERRAILAFAAESLRTGNNIEVVGSRGSGRSVFLRDLRALFTAEEWSTVFVRGIAALKQFPLAALNLPGVLHVDIESRGLSSLHQVTAALQLKVAQPHSIIFLDDWEHLDEASRGVADYVHRAYDVPIVLSRLYGSHAQQSSESSSSLPNLPGYVVEMYPLRVGELDEAIRAHLGAPLAADVLNEVYALTGGHIGIALSLLNEARRDHRLLLDSYGVWVSAGGLS